MRFVHLDGSSYFFDRRHLVVTPEDIVQPATYDRCWATLHQLMTQLSAVPAYQDGWQTLVVKDFDNPAGPAAYLLDYEQGTYAELSPKTAGKPTGMSSRPFLVDFV